MNIGSTPEDTAKAPQNCAHHPPTGWQHFFFQNVNYSLQSEVSNRLNPWLLKSAPTDLPGSDFTRYHLRKKQPEILPGLNELP